MIAFLEIGLQPRDITESKQKISCELQYGFFRADKESNIIRIKRLPLTSGMQRKKEAFLF